jgi:hypothetical protein
MVESVLIPPLTLTQGTAMNPIIAILKEHQVSDDKIKDVFQTLTQNPMMAMNTISQLGIPMEKLQQLMALVMQNPGLIKEAVLELGLDFAKVEAAKAQLQK